MWERLLVTAEEEELPGRCVLRDPNEGTLCWETCKLEGMVMCECVRKGKENVNEKRCKSKIVHKKPPWENAATEHYK